MRFTQFWMVAAALCTVVVADAGANSVDKPTYTQHVAPIFNSNCVTCHRPNDIAPMSLLTYDEVRPWVKSILKNVESRTMPPWHADPGYGPFKNARQLTQDEVDTIVRWARNGAPQGPKKDAPPVPTFDDSGWKLGEPDLVITLSEIEVPAGGPDLFEDLPVALNLDEDKWVKAIEILPGDREVVHHMIIWKGGAAGQSGQGWLGAWAAGADPLVFPDGMGRFLKKGSSIIGDMHYHPAATDRTDQTKLGFHFAKSEEVEKELVNLWVMNDTFIIPPGDANYEAKATYTFSQDSRIIGLAPHQHYRGKDFAYSLTLPDGTTTDLLKVSNYDFNWQTNYEFVEPVYAPKGSRIDCVAHWDNSAENPANPDPTKEVRFGPESYDEMMIGFVDYVVEDGLRPVQTESPIEPKIRELAAQDPGHVFAISIPRDGEMQRSALHVPPEGEGGWYVMFGGGVARARVFDIVWTDDNTFECKASIPGGENIVRGTLDTANGVANMKMTTPDGMNFPMRGDIATTD